MTRKTPRLLTLDEALPYIRDGYFRLHYPGEKPPSISVKCGATDWCAVDVDLEDVLLALTASPRQES